jgi:hypothetical protein
MVDATPNAARFDSELEREVKRAYDEPSTAGPGVVFLKPRNRSELNDLKNIMVGIATNHEIDFGRERNPMWANLIAVDDKYATCLALFAYGDGDMERISGLTVAEVRKTTELMKRSPIECYVGFAGYEPSGKDTAKEIVRRAGLMIEDAEKPTGLEKKLDPPKP